MHTDTFRLRFRWKDFKEFNTHHSQQNLDPLPQLNLVPEGTAGSIIPRVGISGFLRLHFTNRSTEFSELFAPSGAFFG